jgi:predicted amidophosphoribosyltransferase
MIQAGSAAAEVWDRHGRRRSRPENQGRNWAVQEQIRAASQVATGGTDPRPAVIFSVLSQHPRRPLVKRARRGCVEVGGELVDAHHAAAGQDQFANLLSPLPSTLSPMLDLILPIECGGCGAPSTRWCAACADELAIGLDAPRVVTPRVDPGVPVFALGRYAGARRRAIVAMKDRGRTDLSEPLAHALGMGVHRLLTWGLLDVPLTVVPAPTRSWSARQRGGDPVTRMATLATAGHPGITVVRALRMKPWARDSAGLNSAARERNIAGRVLLTRRRRPPAGGELLLVDDIVTTGATAGESVRVLQAAGARVSAVLALAAA